MFKKQEEQKSTENLQSMDLIIKNQNNLKKFNKKFIIKIK